MKILRPERWLSCEEHMLVLQKSWVLFLPPLWQLTIDICSFWDSKFLWLELQGVQMLKQSNKKKMEVFNKCRKNRIEKKNNKFNDQRHLISDRSLLRQEKCQYHSKTTLPLRGLFPTLAVKILLWCAGTVQESATDSTRKQVSQMNTLDHMIRALRIQWN